MTLSFSQGGRAGGEGRRGVGGGGREGAIRVMKMVRKGREAGIIEGHYCCKRKRVPGKVGLRNGVGSSYSGQGRNFEGEGRSPSAELSGGRGRRCGEFMEKRAFLLQISRCNPVQQNERTSPCQYLQLFIGHQSILLPQCHGEGEPAKGS